MNKTKSTAIVYSFKAQWKCPLEKGGVSVFFRKRPPRATSDKVYFYVGSPVCSIIGWSNIIRIEEIDSELAIQIADQASIEVKELLNYLSGARRIGAIFIGKPTIYSNPVRTSEVRKIFNFYPPQNFVRVPSDVCEAMEKFQ